MTKNTINARIVADSIDGRGHRITTFVLTYPRIIHAEMMTHRLFSRNAASSRAIPFKKMVKSIEEDPFIPIAWQKDHKGMQGVEYITDDRNYENSRYDWLKARNMAVQQAKLLNESDGVTKQLCNRLLEPYQWYTCLVTATEFENFYKLRCPQYTNGYDEEFRSRKDYINGTFEPEMYPTSEVGWWNISKSGAEIHIQALAEAMWDAQNESKPNQLQPGEWHMPFMGNFDPKKLLEISGQEPEDFELVCRKIATARAARLSYMTFDGEIDYAKDIALHDQLLASGHFSPFEHCARAMTTDEYMSFIKGQIDIVETDEPNPGDFVAYGKIWNFDKEVGWCNNFKGFIQYRYLLEGGEHGSQM